MDRMDITEALGLECIDILDQALDLNSIDVRDAHAAKLAHIMGADVQPPKDMKPAEVRREAEGRSKRLFISYNDLRAILERHEATIQKRWTKKTQAQRQAMLLTAWPNMPAGHRPDFHAWKKAGRQGRNVKGGGTNYRDAFIWPYINQEDLVSRPRSLLLLLNSRGRHDPCHFAAADGEAMHMGKVTATLRPIFLNGYLMLLNGATSPHEYGKLLEWDAHPDAFEWLTTRKQFLPGEGLLILEAQERLLSFLVSCCRRIMHEIPEDAITGDAFPIKPEPQLKTKAETAGFDSMALMAAEAPYRLPARLDLARVQSLLSARASAAEDHMWSLREDPGYFARTQREIGEHRKELIKDTGGNTHPVLGEGRKNIFWARVMGNMLSEAYLPLETFSELKRQVQDLQALQAKHAASISPLKDLPKEYLHALVQFQYSLGQAARNRMAQLKQHAVASPPLRGYYIREPPLSVSSLNPVILARPGMKMGRLEHELLVLLRILWEDGQDLFLAGLPIFMDELERVLDVEPKTKELISPYIAEIIGDLSIIAQCAHQLDLYHPWANGFTMVMLDRLDDIEAEFAACTRSSDGIRKALGEDNLAEAVRLGDISGGRFAYPIEKRRTRENVETLRRSEGNLDEFWASVDQLIYTKVGTLEGTAVQRLLSQLRILQRTPKWVESVQEPTKAGVVPTTDGLNDFNVLDKPLSALYYVPSTGSSKKPDQVLPKTKTKTRGTTESKPPVTAHNPPREPDSIDPQPAVQVDARALKVFRTLFFNPSPTALPGEVAWIDFLHAMTSMSFTAEKLSGSTWQFCPTTLDVNRNIQFHEPHPYGKMVFRVARRYGRRLNRAYGWRGSMFTLKEK